MHFELSDVIKGLGCRFSKLFSNSMLVNPLSPPVCITADLVVVKMNPCICCVLNAFDDLFVAYRKNYQPFFQLIYRIKQNMREKEFMISICDHSRRQETVCGIKFGYVTGYRLCLVIHSRIGLRWIFVCHARPEQSRSKSEIYKHIHALV